MIFKPTWELQKYDGIFRLVLERKAGKEIPESSRLEIFEEILVNNFTLYDPENNTSSSVYTVKESQGEKGLFHLGQGKSGKLVMVGKNSIFILQVRERISFFIIKEVFRFFPFVLSWTCIIVVFRVSFLGTVVPVEMFYFCLKI